MDPNGQYFVVAAEVREQVKQYVSTMLRSPQGSATINAIAASPKPVSFDSGSLPRVQNGNKIGVTNGQTVPTPGTAGQFAGVQVTLDPNNISFVAQKTGNTDFYIGLKAFAHEDQHVTDILKTPSLQQAAAAGAAGDAPSRPGAHDTEGGSAEGRALDIMGQLGAAAQGYQPDSEWDDLANSIIQQGAAQQAGTVDPQQQLNQAVQHQGCTADSSGQHCN